MDRLLRIDFPAAIYHVTSRGDRREPIVVEDADGESLLALLATGGPRFANQACRA